MGKKFLFFALKEKVSKNFILIWKHKSFRQTLYIEFYSISKSKKPHDGWVISKAFSHLIFVCIFSYGVCRLSVSARKNESKTLNNITWNGKWCAGVGCYICMHDAQSTYHVLYIYIYVWCMRIYMYFRWEKFLLSVGV